MSSFSGLLVGLGNPGPQYAATRHNCGFLCVDALLNKAQKDGCRVVSQSGDKFKAQFWRIDLPKSGTWLVAKPQTFMNLSGECVQPLAAWHRILPEQIVVVHDELDLPPGAMRFKFGGGNAGHNGLDSITDRLGTADFYRLRMGIGRFFAPGQNNSWVLGKFSQAEQPLLEESLKAAVEAIYTFAAEGANATVKFTNKYSKDLAQKLKLVD